MATTAGAGGGAGAAAAQFGFGTPWAAQLDFFRRKLSLPSERWDDIERGAHDRAFIVAGAAKADLLADLRAAVDSTMASGGGLNEFRQKFKAVVAARGWTGWTGEGSAAGEAWRARVIYQTNMAGSYAAGRWQQMTEPSFAALRPFWKYVHADGQLHPRPLHQAWNGITLPKDHAFWKTHFAPNGWGCRCEIHPVAAPAAGAPTQPPAGWDTVDPKTGAPPGIDKGFDYAPGANAATPLQAIIDQKLIKLAAPIGAAMWQQLKPALAMERQAAWWQTLDEWQADPLPRGRRAVVGTLSPNTLQALQDAGAKLPSSAEIMIEDRLVVGVKQRRHMADGNGLTDTEWRALPTLLDAPGGLYREAATDNLIYVAAGAGPAKAALKYEQANHRVVTSFRVSAEAVAAALRGGQWLAVRP